MRRVVLASATLFSILWLGVVAVQTPVPTAGGPVIAAGGR